MADEQTQTDIDLIQILGAAAEILRSGFITGPKDRAKQVFKKIKRGDSVKIATLNLGTLSNAPLNLTLDYSEYVGPGFGFDSFIAALTSMLGHTETAFKQKKDLNMLANEDNNEIVMAALPGIVQRGEQTNVMLMNYSFSQMPNIVLKLMFFDPNQFSFIGEGNGADKA